jgi:dipeptidase E
LAELLLLSNSTAPGRGFLEHALEVIEDTLQDRRRVLFIALASGEPGRYVQIMRDSLAPIGVSVVPAETTAGLRQQIAAAEALFIGGGNTFRLLQRLRSADAVDQIRARVSEGVPFFGASAGAIIACPTIGTTNDMPIVETGSLRALGLIPIQINAHYPTGGGDDPQDGDTRDRQIAGFLQENDVPVLAMPEGAWLHVSASAAVTGGVTGCRLFSRGVSARLLPAGSDVSMLLGVRAEPAR